ncbi:Transposase [Deinococcus deserti]
MECWFSLLTTRQLRRGSFTSTQDLETAIERYIQQNNDDPKPFIWTKTADQILESVRRFCKKQLQRTEQRT